MSNIPTLSWGELWSVYRRSPAHMQQEILEQVNLPEILAYASKKVKKEILDEAPAEVLEEPKAHPKLIQSSKTYEQLMYDLFGANWREVDRQMTMGRPQRLAQARSHGHGILRLFGKS